MNVYRKLKYVLNSRQKRQVAVLIVLIFIGALLETMGISFIIPLVSAVVTPEKILGNAYVQDALSFLGLTSISESGFVRLLLLPTIGFFVIKNLYLLWMSRMQAAFVANTQSDIARRLMQDYLNRPYEFYLNADSGAIIRTFHSDIPHIFELLREVMLLLSEVAVSFLICLLLLILEPVMTLAFAALMLVMVLLLLKCMKPLLGRLGQNRVDQQGRMAKWVQESIGGIKDVKVSAREEHFLKGFGEEYRRFAVTGRRYTVMNNLPRLVIETVCIVGMLAYMFLLVSQGRDLRAMLPQLSAFALAAVRLMPSVNRISTHLSSIAYFETSLNVVAENLDLAGLKDVPLTDRGSGKIKPEKEILLSGISYHYPNSEKQIFDKAELKVPVGASVGVIGTSGAGKTTIVDILLGLLKPQEGVVTVDGKEVDPSSAEWLSGVGYIAQNIFMLDASIAENVAFGIDKEDYNEERVWQVLKEAQLEDFVRGLPDGLDTAIGDRGVRISGGQRQRIGIARALYHDPAVLVFDEATSALDNDTEAAIMEAVGALKGKKTMIIIAHRLKTIENCDIIYKVEEGKILPTELEK
ncbi:MAG: ABC transporter ATP-binding protein [Lachnospiraceae bacterium]|nr:ABC transporter ATP-binding protein [Lachnospiraceae bacterium]